MITSSSIAEAFLVIREANVSTADIAAEAGVSERLVQYWVSGEAEPRYAHLRDLVASRRLPFVVRRTLVGALLWGTDCRMDDADSIPSRDECDVNEDGRVCEKDVLLIVADLNKVPADGLMEYALHPSRWPKMAADLMAKCGGGIRLLGGAMFHIGERQSKPTPQVARRSAARVAV